MQKNSNYLPAIVCLGALLRFIFLWTNGLGLYEAGVYTTGDSFSYTNGFRNLIEFGTYSFDFSNGEAFAGRMPIYPLFWGIHYYLFGPNLVYQAVAFSQIVLDCLTIFLVFRVTARLFTERSGLIAALIYAGYPLAISKVTFSVTETFVSFVFVFFYFILTFRREKYKHIYLALSAVFAFYSRSFLIVLGPIGLVYLILRKNQIQKIKNIIVYCVIYVSIYSLWPIRNYVHSEKFIPIVTKTVGYHSINYDFLAYREWVCSWATHPEMYSVLRKATMTEEKVDYPEWIFSSPESRNQAYELTMRSRTCGSSFEYWRTRSIAKYNDNCNEEVAQGWKALKRDFIKTNTFHYLTRMPISNFIEAITNKTIITDGGNEKLWRGLFTYRALILSLGFLGILLFARTSEQFALVFFSLFMYFFICAMLRQLELRYLLQADIVLIIFAAPIIDKIFLRLKSRYTQKLSNGN